MADSASAPDSDGSKEDSADGLPLPPAVLHVSQTIWSRKQVIHRVHLDRYAADAFNPGVAGNARFSPIKTKLGSPIPTLYGGTSFDCAALETVFHDVPFVAGFKSHDRRKVQGQLHSCLLATRDLVLVDLSNVALRKLGPTRRQLIDTEKDAYPRTRQWAAAIHAQCPGVQGLSWISRQDDRAQALMLFGDRVPPGTLRPQGEPRNLLRNRAAYVELLSLAERIGVEWVAGQSDTVLAALNTGN
jgi:hypothetical protein